MTNETFQRKIRRIKKIRELTGLSLKDARAQEEAGFYESIVKKSASNLRVSA